MSKFPNPGVYPNIDSKEYFGVGVNKDDMTKSVLSKSLLWAFGKNPRRWLEAPPFEGTAATRYGSLIDCLLLTPNRFYSDYVVAPATYEAKESTKKNACLIDKPWNWNATVCKNWKIEQEKSGKILLKQDELDNAEVAVDKMRADPTISYILANSQTQCAVTGKMPVMEHPFEEDQGWLLGEYAVKTLLDIAPDLDSDYGDSLIDLKTTGVMDSPTDIVWNSYKFGYHVQGAFYRDVYNAITGEDRQRFHFIFQMSKAPYEHVMVEMSQDALAKGREVYTELVRKWHDTTTTGEWPSPFDNMTELDLPERAYQD